MSIARRSWLSLMAIAGLLIAASCTAVPGPTATPSGVVSVTTGEVERVMTGGSCTWFEDTGQLFVEAGDSEGADYILLGAPLEWLGEKLPEGPGADPELTLRVGGTESDVEQASLTGTMTAEQTTGTYMGRLADGTPISGDWTCPEVTEGQ